MGAYSSAPALANAMIAEPRFRCLAWYTLHATNTAIATTLYPTSMTDPHGASRTSGPATWLNPNVPHGIPPNGQADLSCSNATHTIGKVMARHPQRCPKRPRMSPCQITAMAPM